MQPQTDLALNTHVDDAAVWRKHKEELVRYATILVGVDHAEDVLSTVVERILRRNGSLTALDDPRSYLFRAVLDESRGLLRRRNIAMTHRMTPTVKTVGAACISTNGTSGLSSTLRRATTSTPMSDRWAMRCSSPDTT